MATIQTRAVLDALARLGHATNLQLHAALSDAMPELSLQSLHRITARLVDQGTVGTVNADPRNVVLDARAELHDHFVCTKCGGIVDIEVPAVAVQSIQEQLGTHLADGGLVVRGRCAICRAAASAAPGDD